MTETPGTIALREYRISDSRAKKLRVIEATSDFARGSELITISSIARAAKVSREFIYAHPELLAAITNAKEVQLAERMLVPVPMGREAGLLAERATLMAKIQRQSQRIEELSTELGNLRAQRERWLGDELTRRKSPVLSDEMQLENDRLTRRLIEQSRELQTSGSIAAGLEEDLRISRLAHAETARELSGNDGHVTVLIPRNSNPDRL